MAQKQLKGVGGVLGSLISPPAAAAPPPEPAESPAPANVAVSAGMATAQQSARAALPEKPRAAASGKVQARRGRPPGRRAGEAINKEKVTLRIDQELMDEYRDWSWEERCQLGELVERAMQQYRKHRTRQKSQ